MEKFWGWGEEGFNLRQCVSERSSSSNVAQQQAPHCHHSGRRPVPATRIHYLMVQAEKKLLFSLLLPPFFLDGYTTKVPIYVEVPTMCLLVWDERISGSLCVINSITRGILRVMVPNSFRDFYTLESLKTFYIFPILYWLLRNVLHIYLPQVLGRMRYYYVETKLQAMVAFTNYMNREFWKIVHIIGV